MESILMTIRRGLGVPDDYSGFDGQIIVAINNAIFSLTQLGIGPATGLVVTGIDETWTQLFDAVTNLEGVKSYILLKSKLEFDPPQHGFLITAIQEQIQELAWRLMVEVDPDPTPEV